MMTDIELTNAVTAARLARNAAAASLRDAEVSVRQDITYAALQAHTAAYNALEAAERNYTEAFRAWFIGAR